MYGILTWKEYSDISKNLVEYGSKNNILLL